MKTRRAITFLLLIVTGCATIRDIRTLTAPTDFFANLTCEDALPDLKHEPGDGFITHLDPPGSSDKYPLHIMAVYTKTNETQRYYYHLQKTAPGAVWEVSDGWTVARNGQKHELRLPSAADQAKANESIGK